MGKHKVHRLFSQASGWVAVGHKDVRDIEIRSKNGEMALVDWYRINYDDGTFSELNGKFVEMVVYTPLDKDRGMIGIAVLLILIVAHAWVVTNAKRQQEILDDLDYLIKYHQRGM